MNTFDYIKPQTVIAEITQFLRLSKSLNCFEFSIFSFSKDVDEQKRMTALTNFFHEYLNKTVLQNFMLVAKTVEISNEVLHEHLYHDEQTITVVAHCKTVKLVLYFNMNLIDSTNRGFYGVTCLARLFAAPKNLEVISKGWLQRHNTMFSWNEHSATSFQEVIGKVYFGDINRNSLLKAIITEFLAVVREHKNCNKYTLSKTEKIKMYTNSYVSFVIDEYDPGKSSLHQHPKIDVRVNSLDFNKLFKIKFSLSYFITLYNANNHNVTDSYFLNNLTSIFQKTLSKELRRIFANDYTKAKKQVFNALTYASLHPKHQELL